MQSTLPPPTHNPNPWQLGPSASRFARWIFGLGFFAVHLGIFLIGGLALLMFNLYRSPDDLWIGGPLIRWGIVVLIHFLGAVITWAFTTAFDAAEATRRESAPIPRTLPPSRRIAATAPQPSASYPPSNVMPPTESEPPRRRFSPTRSAPATTIEVEDRRRVERRERDVMSPAPAAHRASPPGWTVVKGENAEPKPAPYEVTPKAPSTGTTEEVAEDARWTWVEAAAEAWLAGRVENDASKPAEPPSANGSSSS
jgi:cytoskeletal protein RodZ